MPNAEDRLATALRRAGLADKDITIVREQAIHILHDGKVGASTAFPYPAVTDKNGPCRICTDDENHSHLSYFTESEHVGKVHEFFNTLDQRITVAWAMYLQLGMQQNPSVLTPKEAVTLLNQHLQGPRPQNAWLLNSVLRWQNPPDVIKNGVYILKNTVARARISYENWEALFLNERHHHEDAEEFTSAHGEDARILFEEEFRPAVYNYENNVDAIEQLTRRMLKPEEFQSLADLYHGRNQPAVGSQVNVQVGERKP